MKANNPCSNHLVDRGGYYHAVIYMLENGKRIPISRTTDLPAKNNLRRLQKTLDDSKREYDELGLAGLLSLEDRTHFTSMPLTDYMRYVFSFKAPTRRFPCYHPCRYAAQPTKQTSSGITRTPSLLPR